MEKCPQCGELLTHDFLDRIMDRLESEMKVNPQPQLDFIVQAECCENELKAINELSNYYIISEPQKAAEKKIFIGAK